MPVENATIFKILTRLKLSKVYLFFWHKSTFRKLLNLKRVILFNASMNKFSDKSVTSRIASDLTKYGIAKAELTEFKNMPKLEKLQKEYDDLLQKDNSNPHDRKAKSFIQRLVDDDYKFENNESAITQYCFNEEVALACAKYLGLIPKLTSFKIWRSHQTEVQERTASQNWHRDYNEYKMVRIFLYFNNVNKNNGAGEYIIGTHFQGDSFKILSESDDGVSRYSSELEISQNFPPDRLVVAEGVAGTMYFMDTAGLHRGGYHPIPGERRVSLTTFSTAADLMETKIRKPKNVEIPKKMRRIII